MSKSESPSPSKSSDKVVKAKKATTKASKADVSTDGKATKAKTKHVNHADLLDNDIVPFLVPPKADLDANLSPFLKKQKERLLILRDSMLDSMLGVAEGNLRTRAEGSEASAFGLHQADAGSDAYDRDFALSLLSQEQDALYEIEQALKRIEQGVYGECEISGKSIPHARLEAIPFARYTVECQSQLEKQNRSTRVRQGVASLFGLNERDEDDSDDDSGVDNKD